MKRKDKLLLRLHECPQRAYYMAYTAIFLLIAILTYWQFFRYGKSIIWQKDGIQQHYVALVYWGQYLRQIVSDFVSSGKLVVPMFDFSIGYGSDILTTLHYYVIGDPLNLLAIFVPISKTEILFCFLAILRLYLSGITFSLYCKYMGKQSFPTLTGAFIYAFSGFSIFVAVRHPFFINPLIYLPLLLIGVEKILKKQKPNLFIVMICISAISNFYFFYMLTILLLIYTAVRFFTIYGKDNLIKNLIYWLSKFTFFYVVGLLMAGIVFLPTALLTLNTGRANVQNAFDILYYTEYYGKIASSFITQNKLDYWVIMGYSPVALLAVILLFIRKKENYQLRFGFLLLIVFLLFPIMGHIFNGFSYVSNRWICGLGFIVAFITVTMMPDLLNPNRKQITFAAIIAFIYFAQGLLFNTGRSEEFFAANTLLLFSIILMCHNMITKIDNNPICNIDLQKVNRGYIWRYSPKIIIMLIIILGISIQAYYRFSPDNGGYVEEFKALGKAFNQQKENSSSLIEQIPDNSFFRYETNNFGGQVLNHNSSVINRENSVDFAFSLANPYITRFFSEDMYFYSNPDYFYKGLDSRAMLGALAGVKYFVVKPELKRYAPYGYTEIVFNSVIGKDEYVILENDNYLPLGYTYSDIISKINYENLSAIEKQQALLQGAVINDDINYSLNEIQPEFNHSVIPYEIWCGDGITYEDSVFIVNNKKSSVKLTFEGLNNCETYLGLYNLNFSQKNPRSALTEDEWNKLGWKEKLKVTLDTLSFRESDDATVTVKSGNITKSLFCSTPYHSFYTGKHDYLLNLSYSKKGKTEVVLTFQRPGYYSINGLEIICQPMDNLESQVAKLKEDILENIEISTNTVSGTLNIDEPKLLCLSIPYSEGWSGWVDGEEVELLNVNTMYSGIYLKEGNHNILLKYKTPNLIYGIFCSLAGIVIFVVIIVCYKYKFHKTM